MLFLQILIDGFAIGSLYALGAMGFALIFGVSGVLNLSHGALMVVAVVAAWAAGNDLHVGPYAGAAIGVAAGLIASLVTYFVVVRPLQRSQKIREDEKEIFILTATLLWGIMLQELIAYFYTNNAKTVAPIVNGVMSIAGVRTPANELFTAVVCWIVIGLLWLLVNRTRAGKAVLAASMNPRGVTLLGIELPQIYIAVWAIYGVLIGVAGVLLGMFLGVSSYSVGTADRERVLDRGARRPRQRLGRADRGLCGRLSRDHHGLYDLARLSHHSSVAAADHRHVCPPARIVGATLDDDIAHHPRSAGFSCGRGRGRVPAARRLRLHSGPPHHRLLFRRVLDGVGPAVRFRRRGQFRADLPDRHRRLHGRYPRQSLRAADLGLRDRRHARCRPGRARFSRYRPCGCAAPISGSPRWLPC